MGFNYRSSKEILSIFYNIDNIFLKFYAWMF